MSLPPITPDSIVNETLQRYPETMSVFNAFGIDTCCGGAAAIEDAAYRDGADPQALLAALRDGVAASAGARA